MTNPSTNRLSLESSPYLRQHENNPVDWYPWGPEALDRARRENKPILLSVGYSACHWCHVMAHESFEDPATAELMNRHFVNIKVDREERPDLDQVYQNVALLMTQGGGWPLTVFLTPDLRPFFGGTYFPPEDRYGRPGFKRLLRALADAYRDQSGDIEENAVKLTEAIRALSRAKHGNAADSESGGALTSARIQEGLRAAAEKILDATDPLNGGFQGAPKFPNTMVFRFLWRQSLLESEPAARGAVLLTLDRMARGGIYDQLGGGFHRYSVDATWSVPHFEKMLYDNALLLQLYSEVLLTDSFSDLRLEPIQKRLYLDVVRETAAYLQREMQPPEGGYFAAQDADSEGEEGKFFVWTLDEIHRALGSAESFSARAFIARYGVTEEGNFEGGATVLHQARTLPETAAFLGEDEGKTEGALGAARQKLFQLRDRRVHVGLDDKVLVGWNGLAISGMAWASRALALNGYPEEGRLAWMSAVKAYRFVKQYAKQGRLPSTIQKGQAKGNGFLDDYAFLAMAALDLSRWGGDEERQTWVADARRWITTVRNQFTAPDAGFYFTSHDHESLLDRPRSNQDQAIPSGTAVVLECLEALESLDAGGSVAGGSAGNSQREAGDFLDQQLAKLAPAAFERPYASAELLMAAQLRARRAVILSGPGAESICVHPLSFVRDSGSSTRLVCHRETCSLPLADEEAFRSEAARRLRESG